MLSPQKSNQVICQKKKILAFQDFISNTSWSTFSEPLDPQHTVIKS